MATSYHEAQFVQIRNLLGERLMEDLLIVGSGIAGLRAAIEGSKNGKNVLVKAKRIKY